MISLQPKWSQMVESESPDAIRKGLELVWQAKSIVFPKHAPIQYVLAPDDEKGQTAAVIDMRTEQRLHSAHGHEVPLEWLERALSFAMHLKVRLLLVVRFYDGLYYVDVGSVNYPRRGEMVAIPTTNFHEVRP